MTKLKYWQLAIPVHRESGNKVLKSLQIGVDGVTDIFMNDHGIVHVSFEKGSDLVVHGLAWGYMQPPELPAVDTMNTTASAFVSAEAHAAFDAMFKEQAAAAPTTAKKVPPPLPKKAEKR